MKKIKIPIDLIKSTLLVFGISALGGLAFYLVGYSFISSFILLFITQYILFSFLGNLIKSYFEEKTKQKELDSLEPLSTILECSYCGKPNIMTFLPNDSEALEMTCSSCNMKNSVRIQFVVARITEPVNVPNITGVPLVENKN
jgi:hypothetical protein